MGELIDDFLITLDISNGCGDRWPSVLIITALSSFTAGTQHFPGGLISASSRQRFCILAPAGPGTMFYDVAFFTPFQISLAGLLQLLLHADHAAA